MNRTIRTALIALAATVAMGTSSQAAFEYTIGTETKMACSWASVGGALYKAGLGPDGIPAGSKVRKLAKDHAFAIECKAKRDAKRAKKKAASFNTAERAPVAEQES